VIAMASASNILVIPHGSSVFSYHLALASVNVPMSECVRPSVCPATLDSLLSLDRGHS
jgi:L-rhamnonate dehydratase